MEQQTYEKHARFHPLQHFVWLPLSFMMLIGTVIYLVMEIKNDNFSFGTLLFVALVVLSIIPGLLARGYALTLQDRLIRTEEQLRYYILTGEPMDSRLTVPQLIALRFASDTELPALAKKAAEEGTSPSVIKKSITNWRADAHRV